MEAPILSTTRRPLIAFLALLAFVFGQSAAGLHALTHVGSRNDATGAPVQHFQVCLECASFAPLAGAHGGQVQALALERVVTRLPAGLADAAIIAARIASPFQARAPPR